MTIVQREKLSPQITKNELSARPVMIPGSAIGRMNRNEIESRPKNLVRARPNAASDPMTSATAVANRPARSDSHRAVRTSSSCQASENHFVVKPGIGQLWMFDELNAYTPMITRGIHRKAKMRDAHAQRPMRVARVSIRGSRTPPGAS